MIASTSAELLSLAERLSVDCDTSESASLVPPGTTARRDMNDCTSSREPAPPNSDMCVRAGRTRARRALLYAQRRDLCARAHDYSPPRAYLCGE